MIPITDLKNIVSRKTRLKFQKQFISRKIFFFSTYMKSSILFFASRSRFNGHPIFGPINGNLPGLEVWNRIFFAKVTRLLHENDQKYFIQSNLHCYLYIFPTSPEGNECHANKTVRLLNETSYPAILVHFRTKWSVVQRKRGPVMRTDGNPTEPSLENKRHAPVFPKWTTRSFPSPVSLCVMGHYREEKWLCVAFFDNPVVFLVMLDLNRLFAVGWFMWNPFSDFLNLPHCFQTNGDGFLRHIQLIREFLLSLSIVFI